MVERAFIEEAATTRNVAADDFVNAAKRAAPLGVVGSEENERSGADKSCEMREGSVICDEGPAGGEELKEVIPIEVGDREIKGFGKFARRLRAVGRRENYKLNL